MPRFRSVRQRQHLETDQLATSSQSKPATATQFDDIDMRPAQGHSNVNTCPEVDKRFYPNSLQLAAVVSCQNDGVYESIAGVLPSFSKFAVDVAVKMPEMFVSERVHSIDSRSRGLAFPERSDVTVPSRYSLPPNNVRDVEFDGFTDSCRRQTVPDSLDAADANEYRVPMQRSLPYVVKHPLTPSAPSTCVRYATVATSVPSPVLEPEPAQCGDLPLDLTLTTKPQPDKSFVGDTEAMLDRETVDPDYEQVFRRRRHFRNWFQLQSTRQEPSNGSPLDQRATSSDNSPSPRSTVFGCVPDIEFRRSPSTQFKAEVLDDIGSPQTADDKRFESQQSCVVDRDERKALVTQQDVEESRCRYSRSSPLGSPSHEGASRGNNSPSRVASGRYQCSHCEIDFHGSRTLHAIHMGYHSNDDPFQCNVCGEKTNDRVAFFIHLARVAHNWLRPHTTRLLAVEGYCLRLSVVILTNPLFHINCSSSNCFSSSVTVLCLFVCCFSLFAYRLLSHCHTSDSITMQASSLFAADVYCFKLSSFFHN